MNRQQIQAIFNGFFTQCGTEIGMLGRINRNRILKESDFQAMFYHYIRNNHETLHIQTEADYPAPNDSQSCDYKLSDGYGDLWIERKIVARSLNTPPFQDGNNQIHIGRWEDDCVRMSQDLPEDDFKVFIVFGVFDFTRNTINAAERQTFTDVSAFFNPEGNPPENPISTIIEGFHWKNNLGSFSLNAYAWYKFL